MNLGDSQGMESVTRLTVEGYDRVASELEDQLSGGPVEYHVYDHRENARRAWNIPEDTSQEDRKIYEMMVADQFFVVATGTFCGEKWRFTNVFSERLLTDSAIDATSIVEYFMADEIATFIAEAVRRDVEWRKT